MHECPNCGALSISLWRKSRATRASPVRCSGCGKYSRTETASFILAELVGSTLFLVAIIGGINYGAEVSGFAAGLAVYLLMHVLVLHLTPLVPAEPAPQTVLAKPLVRLIVVVAVVATVVGLAMLVRRGA